MRFGALLPHFGSSASPELIGKVAQAADRNGFDSLWVRDHLLYEPHGMEDPDPTFIDGFCTLSYCAGLTENVTFGTAATVPFRNPLVLAKMVSSITNLSGRPFILGIGAGLRDHEFAAVGQSSTMKLRATSIVPETLDVVNAVWDGDAVQHAGDNWAFDELRMLPRPVAPPQIWFCGTSPLSLRLAKAHCTGWVPGRITHASLAQRAGEWAGSTGVDQSPLSVTVIPVVSIAESKEAALRRVDLPGLLDYANKHRWLETSTGQPFRTAEDLDGLLLYGTPEDILQSVEGYSANAVTDVVFDLRLAWDRATEDIEALAEHVIPAIRAGRADV